MKKAVGVAALFVGVFVLGFAWSFPIDAVAMRVVREAEVRSHMRIEWASARWSWWRSTLQGVVVKDSHGRVVVQLQAVDVRPRWGHVDVDARASWGGITASVSDERIEGTLSEYPLSSTLPDLPIADARLGGSFRLLPAKGALQADFTLVGALQNTYYQGPLTLQGTLRAEGRAGTLERVDVTGTGLSGRADVISLSLPTDGLESLRISGPFRLSYKGMDLRFNLSGQGQNITATPMGGPSSVPAAGGPPVPPPPPPPDGVRGPSSLRPPPGAVAR